MVILNWKFIFSEICFKLFFKKGHYCYLNFPGHKPEILNTGYIKLNEKNQNHNITLIIFIVYGISNGISSIALGKFIDLNVIIYW